MTTAHHVLPSRRPMRSIPALAACVLGCVIVACSGAPPEEKTPDYVDLTGSAKLPPRARATATRLRQPTPTQSRASPAAATMTRAAAAVAGRRPTRRMAAGPLSIRRTVATKRMVGGVWDRVGTWRTAKASKSPAAVDARPALSVARQLRPVAAVPRRLPLACSDRGTTPKRRPVSRHVRD